MADNLSKNLQISDLDFDTLKESFKSYLQGQDTFKDYNFDGAGLNYLLDVLAYNTHYQSYYTNMVANEMFLDSAVKRESIVSHAKHLGYTPSSIRAATCVLDIDGSGAGTISKGTVFKSVTSCHFVVKSVVSVIEF